ncbi:unnamed protein product [Ostreobium quekettii]|uniref:SRP54-type proteins GTP-binding domain-containing protein n=1 Tax=Ostreobium quekettii TaxID=121088 RepID=A0A8S1JDS2_9CHLO|nr:unnamed protein product [Ostreobium quekettii]|eukprot:evm.model.scf_1595EXC.1 EVM.evm.TU.scf_1595EXC.1   scf_1595EXC:10164-14687(+)
MQSGAPQRCGQCGAAPELQPLHAPRATHRRARESTRVKAESGASVLRKIGRVFKEKAQVDFDRIFKGTTKMREKLGVVDELLTYWTLEGTEDTLEALEESLIMADFGPKVSLQVCDDIREKILAGKIQSGDDILVELKSAIVDTLIQKGGSTELKLGDDKPSVLLIVGVNGGGKTTTIGKLSHRFSQEGAKVMLGCGDTFRAAAFEQLKKWCDRSGAQMGPFEEGSRPSKILYKTVEQAMKAGDIDIVICDTSGRLHTNYGLMEELKKCRRVLGNKMPNAPNEVLLVLDGTTGLNMLNQAREFHEFVGLTGLVLTKLDGTARGGAVVSVVNEIGVPVKFVGVGETLQDLQAFDPVTFVDALFPAKEMAGITVP